MVSDKPIQINVESKNGKVFLGNDILTLKDETVTQYNTSALDDFISYLDPKTDEVYYSENELVGVEKGKKTFVQTNMKATCKISKTEILLFLMKYNHVKMKMADFEEFLLVARNYLTGDDSLSLLDIVNNFSVNKVKKAVRQKDQMGNYTFSVTSEAGQNDISLPKQLVFNIPIVQHIEHKERLVFDFFFTMKENDMAMEFFFQLRNIDLVNAIENNIRSTIRKTLADKKIDHKYGTFKVIPQTDEWQIKKNELVIK